MVNVKALQKDIEKVREEKIRLEILVKTLQEKEELLLTELEALGIDPENVDAEIIKLEASLEVQHQEIRDILERFEDG